MVGEGGGRGVRKVVQGESLRENYHVFISHL